MGRPAKACINHYERILASFDGAIALVDNLIMWRKIRIRMRSGEYLSRRWLRVVSCRLTGEMMMGTHWSILQ